MKNDIYITRGGVFPRFYLTTTNSGHILIAGATGSGKSTLINNYVKFLIDTRPPSNGGLILLDSKRVEFIQYKNALHTIYYADDFKKITRVLNNCVATIESRYKQMQRQQLKNCNDGDIFIIIDELADLMLYCKDAIKPLSQIALLGRAAGFHIIAGTQRPTRDIITPIVSVNFIHKIALHTATAQDSRNIIGITGAEQLPLYGYGILQTPGVEIQKIKIDILK